MDLCDSPRGFVCARLVRFNRDGDVSPLDFHRTYSCWRIVVAFLAGRVGR